MENHLIEGSTEYTKRIRCNSRVKGGGKIWRRACFV